ncbi:MAG: glycoside hydrolase family 5 protein [Nitrospinota bacterium]
MALWLSNDGPHLRGANVHPCTLHELAGARVRCVRRLKLPDLRDLRKLGANLVNASYFGVFTERPPYKVNPRALKYLDDLIRSAEKAGLYVVIHFRTGPGRNNNAIGASDTNQDPNALFTVWDDAAAQKAWAKMWRFTAQRYGKSPVVIGYNLIVEPHVNTLVDPRGTLTPAELQSRVKGTLRDWNAFSASMVAAIREVDTETPIIIDALQWARAEWLEALEPGIDRRIVYSFHAYDPMEFSHQNDLKNLTIRYPGIARVDGKRTVLDKKLLEKIYRPAVEFAARHSVPIYVGEMGSVRWAPGAVAFHRDLIHFIERNGWNYAFYVWRGDWVNYDGANLEHGRDPDNHRRVDNPLLGAYVDHWRHNKEFPPHSSGASN